MEQILIKKEESTEKFDGTKNEYQIIMKNHYLTKNLAKTVSHKNVDLFCNVVDFNGKKYVTYKIFNNYLGKVFVCDFDDYEKIKKFKWAFGNNGYVSTRYYIGNRNMSNLYLHNLIMDQLEITTIKKGKTVDHINRIPLDNRKENLHLINQSEQNLNQNKKQRQLTLPECSHIKINDIPRGVSYIPVFKNHGDGFEVHLPQFNNSILKYYSSRDTTLTLRFKLEQIKKFLRYTKSKFPEEFAKHHIETEYNQNEIDLIDSYNEIIKLSGFPEYKNNLITYNTQNYLTEDLTNLTDNEKKLLETIQFENKTKKKLLTVLPDGCGITVNMIPKYCYYAKARGIIGDGFVIDKHPKLNGKTWSTQTNKKLTTREKFDQLLKKLKELDQT